MPEPYQQRLSDELLRCRQWIEEALNRGGNTHTFEDVVRGIFENKMHLWAGEKGCAVTEIVVYPRKKYLHVFLAAGEMGQILDFEKSAERLAREIGCDGLSIAGREGWKRVLGKRGWKPYALNLMREWQE